MKIAIALAAAVVAVLFSGCTTASSTDGVWGCAAGASCAVSYAPQYGPFRDATREAIRNTPRENQMADEALARSILKK